MPPTKTQIYLAVISRIHAIRPRNATTSEPFLADPPASPPPAKSVKIDVATEHGDSSKHLLARVLPEMEWMPKVPASIVVEHQHGKPTDDEVRTAIQRSVAALQPPAPPAAAPAPAPPPPPPLPGFGLGENVFSGPDNKPSKWTDSGWKAELTVAGDPDDSDYVAGFQITYGGPKSPYYQSIVYSSSILLRIDYLLVAQQASIPS